jgi:WD40 repeat protein
VLFHPIAQAGESSGNQVVAQASCQLYAVNDKGLNNSQFFTVNLDDLTVSELGSMYKGHDIEALAVHPKTDMIYAASGDNVTNGKKGHFYRVDGQTGELFPIGSTGFKEIEDLTFSPDGTLYAWAKGDGLITIDLVTGKGTLVLPYENEKPPIEGLTLKKNESNVFFGAVGTDLWQYDMNTDTLDVLCPNQLLGETEALEITPEGLLLIGTHNVPFGLHAFDVQSCQVIEADETLSNKFDDVEGIALPVNACNSTQNQCAEPFIAQQHLLDIAEAQNVYYREEARYPDSLETSGISSEDAFYNYAITTVSNNGFLATATSKVGSDVWTINQNWKLVNTTIGSECSEITPVMAKMQVNRVIQSLKTLAETYYQEEAQWPSSEIYGEMGDEMVSDISIISNDDFSLQFTMNSEDVGVYPNIAGKTVRMERDKCGPGSPKGVAKEFLPANCQHDF